MPLWAALASLTLALWASLALGCHEPRPFHFLRTLLEPTSGQSAERVARLVVFHLRAPRAVVAALSGAALAVSGAALQTLFRNPLADPSLLGVSASAALTCQLVLFAGLAQLSLLVMPLAATAGGAVATLLLISLFGRRGSTLTVLLLGGLSLAQLAAAASGVLLSLAIRDYTRANRMLAWMLGSLDGRTWAHVGFGVPPLVLGGWLLARQGRALDGLGLGELTARSLGVDVASVRRRTVLATALLTGASVAMSGVIGFVGLLVPHLARSMVRGGQTRLLPMTAVLGAGLLVWADLVARWVIAPAELPLGVVMAALGAPSFMFLLRRQLRGLSP